jgi:hypothetical protein
MIYARLETDVWKRSGEPEDSQIESPFAAYRRPVYRALFENSERFNSELGEKMTGPCLRNGRTLKMSGLAVKRTRQGCYAVCSDVVMLFCQPTYSLVEMCLRKHSY